MLVKIKPLSVNDAWGGRRYKTPEYKVYEEELLWILPRCKVPEGKLEVYYEFGLSSKNADYDNCIKQFQDCIAKKYGFNDKNIYDARIKKVDVEKGKEYIKFEIYGNNQ